METYYRTNPIDKDRYPNCYEGYQYALQVVSGIRIECKYVIGACERFLKDYKKCSEGENYYFFDIDIAERYLYLVQKLNHVIGEWDTKNIIYVAWQKFLWMNVIGFRHRKNKKHFRFRNIHAEIARGNAKSAMASQCVLYFIGLDESRVGNHISCFATKTDQARIVLDSSRAMALSNPSFLEKSGVRVMEHTIVHKESFSEVNAMSADDTSMDGLNLKLAVCDELHQMTRKLYDVIVSGMKKRRDSLTLCITTAGFNTESVGYSQSNYAKKICLGELQDDTTFAIVYTIDEGDNIFDEITWMKANPNYGISVDALELASAAKKAKESPADLPNFKVKHLNIWLSEASAFFDTNKWDKCADLTLDFTSFYGNPCYAAVDLASKVDLASIGILFRKGEKYYFFDKSYIPEATVEEVNSDLYRNCISEGYLISTPGESIDYSILENDLVELSKKIKIMGVPYDPWNATQFAQNLSKKGVEMIEFRMNVANLSEAMKTLDALIREGNFVHNGSPLLKFCIGNVVAKPDHNGNVYPRKNNEKLKIDPIITAMMCLAMWIQEGTKSSVYETRGIRTL